MANNTYKTRLQLKNDTAENWAKATNFVPLAGEAIIYSDLNKIKIGDGSTNVNDLEFVGDGNNPTGYIEDQFSFITSSAYSTTILYADLDNSGENGNLKPGYYIRKNTNYATEKIMSMGFYSGQGEDEKGESLGATLLQDVLTGIFIPVYSSYPSGVMVYVFTLKGVTQEWKFVADEAKTSGYKITITNATTTSTTYASASRGGVVIAETATDTDTVPVRINSTDHKLYTSQPEVPTSTSQLTNDSGFLTEHQSLEGYAKTEDIPTKTSQLTNDSGYLTEHQDISGKEDLPLYVTATESSLSSDWKTTYGGIDVETSVAIEAFKSGRRVVFIDNFTGRQIEMIALEEAELMGETIAQLVGVFTSGGDETIVLLSNNQYFSHISPYVTKDTLTEGLTGKADTDHTHSQYLTEIPSEYVTETELTAKGYLTEHQSLSDYAKTADVPTKTSDLTNDSGFLTEHQDISGKADVSALQELQTQLNNSAPYVDGETLCFTNSMEEDIINGSY